MALGHSKNRRRQPPMTSELFRAHLGRSVMVALLIIGGVGAAGGVGYVWAARGPAFRIEAIHVSGTQRSTEKELLRLSGLTVGQSLLTAELRAAERSIELHPWVKRADLSRRWPRAVSIEIVEHEPAAIAALGDLYVVDADGKPFKRLSAQDGLDLPLVTGLKREAYIARPDEVSAQLARALAAARAFAADGENVSEVRVDGTRLVLVSSSGLTVALDAESVADGLGRLQRVRAELERRSVRASAIFLDNRLRPGWVAVRTRSGKEPGHN